jgi:hypothetical protein
MTTFLVWLIFSVFIVFPLVMIWAFWRANYLSKRDFDCSFKILIDFLYQIPNANLSMLKDPNYSKYVFYYKNRFFVLQFSELKNLADSKIRILNTRNQCVIDHKFTDSFPNIFTSDNTSEIYREFTSDWRKYKYQR